MMVFDMTLLDTSQFCVYQQIVHIVEELFLSEMDIYVKIVSKAV